MSKWIFRGKRFQFSKFLTITLLGGNILALASNWFISFWRYNISPEYIPLHYTVYFGFDRFGPRSDIFLFATLGTVIFIVNDIVAIFLFKENQLWRRVFLGLTLFMQIILLVSMILVILIS